MLAMGMDKRKGFMARELGERKDVTPLLVSLARDGYVRVVCRIDDQTGKVVDRHNGYIGVYTMVGCKPM
jgi:hypothetical protein